MAEPRNRKLAQPFAILDLASDQDNFLAFGVAGFCHGCFRLDQDAEKFCQRCLKVKDEAEMKKTRSLLNLNLDLTLTLRLGRLDEAIRRQYAVQ